MEYGLGGSPHVFSFIWIRCPRLVAISLGKQLARTCWFVWGMCVCVCHVIGKMFYGSRDLVIIEIMFFSPVSPIFSFSLSCSCLTALSRPYNLNVLRFASLAVAASVWPWWLASLAALIPRLASTRAFFSWHLSCIKPLTPDSPSECARLHYFLLLLSAKKTLCVQLIFTLTDLNWKDVLSRIYDLCNKKPEPYNKANVYLYSSQSSNMKGTQAVT